MLVVSLFFILEFIGIFFIFGLLFIVNVFIVEWKDIFGFISVFFLLLSVLIIGNVNIVGIWIFRVLYVEKVVVLVFLVWFSVRCCVLFLMLWVMFNCIYCCVLFLFGW